MRYSTRYVVAAAISWAALAPSSGRAQEVASDNGSRIPSMFALGMGAGFVGALGGIAVAEMTGGVAARVGGSGARGTGEWIGLVAVQPLATAWGVHVGNIRRGSGGRTVLASYAATAATGVVAAAIANARGESLEKYTSDNVGFFLAGIAAQTVAAIAAERATTPPARASNGVALAYDPMGRAVVIRRSF